MVKVKINSCGFMGDTLPDDVRLAFDTGKQVLVEVENGTCIGELFENMPWLGRPYEEFIVVSINGQQKALDYVLQQDDVVDVIIPAAGG